MTDQRAERAIRFIERHPDAAPVEFSATLLAILRDGSRTDKESASPLSDDPAHTDGAT